MGLPPYSDLPAWERLRDSKRTQTDIATEAGTTRQAVSAGFRRSGAVLPTETGNFGEYLPWTLPLRDYQQRLPTLLRELHRLSRGEPVENAKAVREFLDFLGHGCFPDGVVVGPVVVVYDADQRRFFFEKARPEELNPRVYARARAYT